MTNYNSFYYLYLYTLRNGVDLYPLKYLEFSSLLFNPKISTATTTIYYVLVTNLIPIQLTSSVVVVCYPPTPPATSLHCLSLSFVLY